jgi:hypothetical protein
MGTHDLEDLKDARGRLAPHVRRLITETLSMAGIRYRTNLPITMATRSNV